MDCLRNVFQRVNYQVLQLSLVMIIAFGFIFSSCNQERNVKSSLSGIDTYIDEHPDSALKAINAIDTNAIRSRCVKAKYALLKSIALDKNYIDTTDTRIIAPAVEYYRHHGSKDDRLKTYYYLGRIRQNDGMDEEAIKYFALAERYEKFATDNLSKARLHFAMSKVYHDIFDVKDAMHEEEQAGKYALIARDTDYYVQAMVEVSGNLLSQDSLDAARSRLNDVKRYLGNVERSTFHSYYELWLKLALNDSSDAYGIAKTYLERYKGEEGMMFLPAIADAYMQNGDYIGAVRLLQEYFALHPEMGEYEKASCYARLSKAYDSLKVDDKALDSYRKYHKIVDNITYKATTTDTKYIRERLQAAERRISLMETAITISLSLLAAIVIILLLLRIIAARRREKSELEASLKELKIDNDSLKAFQDALSKMSEDGFSGINITERIKSLSTFWDDEADNRKLGRAASSEIVYTIGISFALKKPAFISYLSTNGLTAYEIGLCCLYALGYNGKDVSSILKIESQYNKNNSIRKKLGMSKGDTNLAIYIRDKYENIDSFGRTKGTGKES